MRDNRFDGQDGSILKWLSSGTKKFFTCFKEHFRYLNDSLIKIPEYD